MKTADSIPVGKLERAGKILKTGLKIGANYASYYGEKLLYEGTDRDKLDRNNASDIMDGLQELKGSGLKLAQMLSMEEHLLPQAYVEQFSLAQFSVPPLSGPLVKRTFIRFFSMTPEQVFDKFDYQSKYAASIGQVHEAWKDGVRLAVKIQYPGVADSIKSDLAMLKPLASTILKVKIKDTEKYFNEVESKLLEETDYNLELRNSIELSEACAHFDQVTFPEYYPNFSNERILTMKWVEGIHLSEWCKKPQTQELRNRLGQQLWDFFLYQVHVLRKVHADPHPGNILITPENQLAVIDFGCTKVLPDDFYLPYSKLTDENLLNERKVFESLLEELEILYLDDDPKEYQYFSDLFHEILGLLLMPFHKKTFDFSDDVFFEKIGKMAENLSKVALSSPYRPNRGSKHFLYTNRVFFGLYNLLHMLKAKIDVRLPEELTSN